MRKLLLGLLAVSFLPKTAFCADGDDFIANSVENVAIKFQVISESAKTCKVYANYPNQAIDNSYEGPLTIPGVANGYTVVDMDAGAFHQCNITSVVLPATMTEWGSYANNNYSDFFSKCSNLTSVSIPEGIRAIGQDAFYDTSALTSITIPSTVEKIWSGALSTEMTTVVFDNCYPQFLADNSGDYDKPFTSHGSVMTADNHVYYPASGYVLYTNSEELRGATFHPQIHINREWTTYCATASFEVPEGIDAYVAKSYNEGVVTLQKVTTINSGQGVLLKPASVGTFYDATLCASTPEAYESNMLRGVTTATAISSKDGEYTNFIFTKVDDEIGFYPAKAGTIPAYKAYLQIPTASLPVGAPARLSVVFEDGETTSITPVRNNQKTSDEWYTLGGQRSTKPTERGIYIHEGKKVIIK